MSHTKPKRRTLPVNAVKGTTPGSSLKPKAPRLAKRSPWPLIVLAGIVACGLLVTGVAVFVQHLLSARAKTDALAVATSAPVNDSQVNDRSWFYGHDTCLATDCNGTQTGTAARATATPSPVPQHTDSPSSGDDANSSSGVSHDIGSLFMSPDQLIGARGGGGSSDASMMDAQYDDAHQADMSSSSADPYNGTTMQPTPPTQPPDTPSATPTPIPASNWRVASTVEEPAGKYVIQAPAMIPATLDVALVSSKASTPIALISTCVYDSLRLHDCLVPRGTVATGEWHEAISNGMNVLSVKWTRLKFPNGKTYVLPGFESSDSRGASGLNAHVDKHLGNILGTGTLLSLFGVLPVLANNGAGASVNTTGSVGAAFLQSNLQTATALQNAIIGAQISQPPTLSVPIGTPLLIAVTKDMVFPGPYPFTPSSEAP